MLFKIGIPLFVQNIFLSSLDISKTKFIITTFLGFLPYLLFYSFVGDQFSNLLDIRTFEIRNFLSKEFIFIIIVLIIILLLRIFFKFK